MELRMICMDCLNKLKQLENGEFICTFCKQKFILVYTLVRIDSYNPKHYIETHEDDPWP